MGGAVVSSPLCQRAQADMHAALCCRTAAHGSKSARRLAAMKVLRGWPASVQRATLQRCSALLRRDAMLSRERSAVTVDRDAAQKPGRHSHSCGGRQTWADSGAKLRYIIGTLICMQLPTKYVLLQYGTECELRICASGALLSGPYIYVCIFAYLSVNNAITRHI